MVCALVGQVFGWWQRLVWLRSPNAGVTIFPTSAADVLSWRCCDGSWIFAVVQFVSSSWLQLLSSASLRLYGFHLSLLAARGCGRLQEIPNWSSRCWWAWGHACRRPCIVESGDPTGDCRWLVLHIRYPSVCDRRSSDGHDLANRSRRWHSSRWRLVDPSPFQNGNIAHLVLPGDT